MAESRIHALLVEALAKWIIKVHLQGQENGLLVDMALGRPGEKPPRIPNYSPDAYSKASKSFEVIVGEAKTALDLQSKHTEAQLAEFLSHCAAHKKALLVLAVPWYSTRAATRLLTRLKKTTKSETVVVEVLEKLPG